MEAVFGELGSIEISDLQVKSFTKTKIIKSLPPFGTQLTLL